MPPAPRNLVNVKAVAKGYGIRSVLRDVTLGVAAGERIGVVGRNGDGKSTLLKLLGGLEAPDAGAVTRTGGVQVEVVGQRDDLDASRTVRDELLGGRAQHEWAADAQLRGIVEGLVGGLDLDGSIASLLVGVRRRIALARALLGESDLLLLEQTSNHYDYEGY